MDLIYTDRNRNDIGVVLGFTADFAFGRDENDFAIQIPFDFLKGMTPIEDGYYFYVDGTEYGGIVDSITIDTQEELITYSGRTWRGLLLDKVIEPNTGYQYRWNFVSYSGEANAMIGAIINLADMGDVFMIPDEESEVIVDPCEFRYDVVLTALMDVLYRNNGKLMLRYSSADKKCLIYAEPLVNYSALSDVDSSQNVLYMEKLYNKVNHIICIGRWVETDRYIIHVFGDGNGGVLPYLTDMTKEPIEDSDYILDKRYQQLFGIDEITAVIDDEESADTVNYKMLATPPADWETNYFDYFEIPEDAEGDSYSQIERNIQSDYSKITGENEPQDWHSNPERYYYIEYNESDEADEYVQCKGRKATEYPPVNTRPSGWKTKKRYKRYYTFNDDTMQFELIQKKDKYDPLTKEPADWINKYNKYYLTDGLGNYSSVGGIGKNKYVHLTEKPSEWAQNWSNYYVNKGGKYKRISEVEPYKSMLKDKKKKVSPPKFVAKKYYVQEAYYVAPKFNSFSSVYKLSKVIPNFNDQDVYDHRDTQINESTWEAGKFYTYNGEYDAGVPFTRGTYYEQVYDHYATLVEQAVQKLTDTTENDKVELRDNVNVEDRWQYDVGDIAGGTEHFTGIETAEMVSKKIVHIENGIEDITYEMG